MIEHQQRVVHRAARNVQWLHNDQPPAVHAPFADTDIPYGLTQLGRLADADRAELDLIGMRLSWLVIGESFIFSAFATAVSAYDPSRKLALALLYIIWVMPLLGMLLAGCVYVAILAAQSAGDRLKEQRDRLMERLPQHLRISLISTKSREHWWGNVPPRVIPPVIFLVWLGALVSLLILFSHHN